MGREHLPLLLTQTYVIDGHSPRVTRDVTDDPLDGKTLPALEERYPVVI